LKRPFWVKISQILGVFLVVFLFEGCTTGPSNQDLAREYYNIGNAFSQLKRYKEASDYYRRALELNPTMNQADFNLARTLIETEQYSLAYERLELLRSQDPENLLILRSLAYASYFLNDKKKALEWYRQVLERTPLDKETLFNTGYVAQELGLGKEALGYFLEFRKQGGTHKELLKLLVQLQKEFGVPEDEKKILEEFLVQDTQNVEAHVRLGEILESEELFKPSIQAFERARAILEAKNTPDSDLTWRIAALTLVRLQDVDAALPLFEKAFSQGFTKSEKVASLLALEGLPQKERLTVFFAEKGPKGGSIVP